MKKIAFFIILSSVLFLGCNQGQKPAQSENEKDTAAEDTAVPQGSYGEVIDKEGVVEAENLPALLASSQSVNVKLKGKIAESCTHTGCWMNVDLGNDQILMVTFKDGDYTIPLDAAGKDVIFKGTAYKEVIPVDLRKKMAADEGLSQEDIDEINTPGYKYTFIADGLLLED